MPRKPDALDEALARAMPAPELPAEFLSKLRRARQSTGDARRKPTRRVSPAAAVPSPAVARFTVNDGALEAIKWLALILMIGDHVNKYLLGGQVHVLYAAGRLVFPLFAFVFAYNLARPATLAGGAYGRAIKRLAAVAAVASVPFLALGGLLYGWWPLNILASFLVSAGVMYLAERGGAARLSLAALLFLGGGLVVEFWWPGIAMTLAAWCFARRQSAAALAVWVIATASLGCIPWLLARVPMSLSLWSLAAFPVIALAARMPLRLPRLRWAFYAAYPAHLAVLWLVQLIQSRS